MTDKDAESLKDAAKKTEDSFLSPLLKHLFVFPVAADSYITHNELLRQLAPLAVLTNWLTAASVSTVSCPHKTG